MNDSRTGQTRSLRRSTRPAVAVVLLAAGASRRTGAAGPKLLAQFDGEALIRRMAIRAIASHAAHVLLVTGHARDEIEAAVAGLDLSRLHNAGHASGLGGSVALGATQAERLGADGALMLPADMPLVTAAHLDRMIRAFRRAGGHSVVRATGGGRPGNPLLLPAALFPALRLLAGDRGARALVETGGWPVVPVEIGRAAHLDVDTAAAIVKAGGVPACADRTEDAPPR